MSSTGGAVPTTWFLPAERAAPPTLEAQIALAACNPIVDVLLRSWSGAVAVLNAERQIVALNAAYLHALGVDDPAAVLGLRPGEAMGCDRAADHPGGCGTGKACTCCGAALAIVSALARDAPEERDCVLAVRRGPETLDLEFKVRASPLAAEAERFVILTLVDVTADRRRAALERAFFHDLANLVSGLSGACAALADAPPGEIPSVAEELTLITARLAREIQLQRALASARPGALHPSLQRVEAGRLLEDLRTLLAHHPAAAGKRLRATRPDHEVVLDTDPFLLHRVVANMVVNALEAAPAGAEVRLEVVPDGDQVAFRVWNPGAIPAPVAARVFQRHFSTKAGAGRGQGTFVMKHFGERHLGGQVGFTTGEAQGTTFTLTVPRSLGAPVPPWARDALPI